MFTDPSKRQYLIFSFIISLIISILLSFPFADILSSGGEIPYLTGFPVNVAEMEGLSKFGSQLFNTFVLTLLLVIPIYLGIEWFRNRIP